MSVAPTLQNYLQEICIDYDLVPHERAYTANHIAQAAHVPGKSVAKGVLLNTDHGYIMAVVPASHLVDLSGLSHMIKARLGLATTSEIEMVFDDCDPGAAPPCATAYAMRVIVDSSLDEMEDIYLESGDHETLIHVDKAGFAVLMAEAQHGSIAKPH